MAELNAPQKSLPQYDYLRQRAKQEALAKSQEDDDAIKRRFAAMGQLNSGAAIKTAQQGQIAANKQAADVQNQIGVAEQAEMQRQKEIQDQRDFAAQEAEKGRTFQSLEGEKGRTFQSEEAGKQRLFNQDLFNQDMEFKKKVQSDTIHFAELDNLFREKEFAENKSTSAFNKALALKTAGVSDPIAMQDFYDLASRFGLTGITSGYQAPGYQQAIDARSDERRSLDELRARQAGYKNYAAMVAAGGK